MQVANLTQAGYYKLEVWGAQGGGTTTYNSGKIGGYGGYSYGTINTSTIGNIVYVVVGEMGKESVGTAGTYIAGGYNGGGRSGYHTSYPGGSGGGATHISNYNCGELKNCLTYQTNILIVAGGGGGGGACSNRGQLGSGVSGSGGGYVGGQGYNYHSGGTHPQGGTQNAGGSGSVTGWNNTEKSGGNGSFGLGGDGGGVLVGSGSSPGGGGGGGWHGGGGGEGGQTCGPGTGAGGSGYLNTSKLISNTYGMHQYNASSTGGTTYTTKTTSTGAHVTNYANTGNGYAKITYLGTSI